MPSTTAPQNEPTTVPAGIVTGAITPTVGALAAAPPAAPRPDPTYAPIAAPVMAPKIACSQTVSPSAFRSIPFKPHSGDGLTLPPGSNGNEKASNAPPPSHRQRESTLLRSHRRLQKVEPTRRRSSTPLRRFRQTPCKSMRRRVSTCPLRHRRLPRLRAGLALASLELQTHRRCIMAIRRHIQKINEPVYLVNKSVRPSTAPPPPLTPRALLPISTALAAGHVEC